MNRDAVFERLLRCDRVIVMAALIGIVAVAWAYLLLGAGMGISATIGAVIMPMPWTLTTFLIVAVMWIVMMVAMMLPSAAPMILLFAAIDRRKVTRGSPYGATGLFALGYLLVWTAFSFAATGAQRELEQAKLLSPAMATGSTALAGTVFLLAGIYQLTPLKQACLRQCRSPLDFLTRYWRGGSLGSLCMGLRHGLFCLGCCWAVMALLFVGGVMNVLWIAALALFILAEKVMPSSRLLGRAAGLVLILWGGAVLLAVIT